MPPSLRPHPVSPFEQSRAPGEPGTHASHQHERAGLQHAVTLRVRKCERDRARRGISVAVDVHDDLLLRYSEFLRCVVDDADVCLMGNVDVYVVHRSTACLEDPLGGMDHDTRRELENLSAVHLHIAVRVIELARAAAGEPQVFAAAAVRAELEAEEAALLDRL